MPQIVPSRMLRPREFWQLEQIDPRRTFPGRSSIPRQHRRPTMYHVQLWQGSQKVT